MEKNHFKNLIALALLMLSLSVTLSADTLSVVRCINPNGYRCWAGAMEGVVKFYDSTALSKTQVEIVSHITTNMKEVPSTDRLLKGLQESMEPLDITVTESTDEPTEEELQAETDSNYVLYVLYSWKTQNGYHAAVYAGYLGDSYYLMDPWSNPAPYAKRSYRSLMETNSLKWQRCFKFRRPQPTSIAGKNSKLTKKQTNFKIVYNTQPSGNTLTITFNMLSGNERMMKIFNMRGSCVYETNIGKNVLQAQLDLSNTDFSSGMYFISIDNTENRKQAICIVK